MKASAKFGKAHRVKIVGREEQAVAITDGALLSRLIVLEERGRRVAHLPNPHNPDVDLLAIVNEKGQIIVQVDYDPAISETDQLRVLVEALDLDEMPANPRLH